MAKAEIDSFILIFKNLLISGRRNATLVIKSNDKKVSMLISAKFFLHMFSINIIGPVMDRQDSAVSSGELKHAQQLPSLKKNW